MTRRSVTGLIGVGLGFVMLVSGPEPVGATADGPVTFSEHVAPIVFEHCTTCHRPGEAAPFPLRTYAEVRPYGRQIAAATRSRVMPPWKAGHGDYAFKNERRLSDDQIALFEQWVTDGMLEGDRSKLPPMPTFTQGWQLGTPDLVVTMGEAFEVPASGPDVYRNFVLPLNLDADTWVRAVDFRPSARAVVHHSLFFLDATGAAREQDARDPQPGYSGAMGVGGAQRLRGGRAGVAGLLGRGRGPSADADTPLTGSGGLGGWAVGGRANELPDGLAFFVPKGSDLILSTHFHPSGRPEREQSAVGIYFAPGPPDQSFTGIQLPPLFGVFEGIDIPAGEERYTLFDSFVIPIDVNAFAVGAHAHYLGREMKLTATLPDGAVKTLLWIPDWDFSWQDQYQFDEFVPLPKGTRLDVTITYDNSAANRRNPVRPPVRVTWGEESTDEMGSVGLRVVAANPREMPQLRQAYAEHLRREALEGPGLRQLMEERGLGRGRGRGRGL